MTQTNFLTDDVTSHTNPRLQARARRTDPATSHEAAERVESSGTAKAHQAIIAAAVKEHPGLTAGELPQHCGLLYEHVHKRLSEIERLGHIKRGPTRACTVRRGNPVVLTWWPV